MDRGTVTYRQKDKKRGGQVYLRWIIMKVIEERHYLDGVANRLRAPGEMGQNR